MLYVISASLLYCDILHLYNIVIVHKFSNICKPEEGWYGQLKYCYKKQYTLFVSSTGVKIDTNGCVGD